MKTLDNLVAEFKAIETAFGEGKATSEQLARLNDLPAEIDAAQKSADALSRGAEVLRALGQKAGERQADDGEFSAKSLGEHLAHHLKVAGVKSGTGQFQFSTPEFGAKSFETKLATDTLVTGGTAGGLVDTDVQRRVVSADGWRPTIASLFAQGTVNGTALKYFVEGVAEGDVTAVAENATKPQLNFTYTPVTEGLAKLAGFIKESDEFVEDLGFLASVTNGRLLRKLAQAEENQLVNGSGTAPNLRGLLNRTGLQTMTVPATSAGGGSIAKNAEQLFSAAMAVQNVTGLVADGLVINPADYERIRLLKDGNGQYYGGGFFSGQYGVGGMSMVPPLWGIPTIVSSAVAVGTAIVGAFGTAAMLFRKGGVRVDVANQNQDDFVNNRITIRAEERLGLAVYVPSAFVRVSLYVSG